MDWKRRICWLSVLILCTGSVAANSVVQAGETDRPTPVNVKVAEADSVIADQAGSAMDSDVAQLPASAEAEGESAAESAPRRFLIAVPEKPEKVRRDPDVIVAEGQQVMDGGLRQGGDICRDAVVIPSLPYGDTGTTFGYMNDYDTANCNGPSTSLDVVYSFTPAGTVYVNIDLCLAGTTHEDSRLIIYEDDCVNPEYACNDDGSPAQCGRQAYIGNLTFYAGHTYYIVIDGWDGLNGDYEMYIWEPEPGACCEHIASPPDYCSNGIPGPECTGLAMTWEEGATCPIDCISDPIPESETPWDCDAGSMFGPGAHHDTGITWYVSGAVSDYTVPDRIMYDAFWLLPEPISTMNFWVSYADLDFTAGCEKANLAWDIIFYADDNNKPGDVVAGPYTVSLADQSLIEEDTGYSWTSNNAGIYKNTALLPVPVFETVGWVAAIAHIDPGQGEDCVGYWYTHAYVDIPWDGTTGDNRSWTAEDGGTEYPGDETMCLGPPTGEGACCNQDTFVCTNGVLVTECMGPNCRWVENLDCNQLDPECGYGACCFEEHSADNCEDDYTGANCVGASGVWHGGSNCATDPSKPEGVHCPPDNDICENLLYTPPIGLPQLFVGRNDGTTADCPDVGPAAWEAFTLDSGGGCWDVAVDYCTTDPPFLQNMTPYLLPACCDYEGRFEATSVSQTDRFPGHASCCDNDPPGYDDNYMVIFENVLSGTWYVPVTKAVGSMGHYTVHVTGGDCVIGPGEDCNTNGLHDLFEIDTGLATDCDSNGVPDDCDPDCNGNGTADPCEVPPIGMGTDCNGNKVPDECECGDWNGDGLIGHVDYAQFQTCFEGPGVAVAAGCECMLDSDGDGDLDLEDFWAFQHCRSSNLLIDYDCVSPCPPGALIEPELDCGLPEDTTNGGCNMDTPAFTALGTIGCGTPLTICGTFATSNGVSTAKRDTDWYTFTLAGDTRITWSVEGEAPLVFFITRAACGGGDLLMEVDACDDGIYEACLPGGDYYLVIVPEFYEDVVCGAHYTVTIDACESCTAPTGACCPSSQVCEITAGITCSLNGGTYFGDDTLCEPNPCLPLPEIGSSCPEHTCFGPGLGGFGTAATSDEEPGYVVFDNFWLVAEDIHAVTWWGVTRYNGGSGWVACTSTNYDFNIAFWNDAGGEPDVTGSPVYGPYTLTATVVDSGDTFSDSTVWEYTVVLPVDVPMDSGWVSIQGVDESPNECWDLWINNTDDNGDGVAAQMREATSALTELTYDMSMCLQSETGCAGGGGGECVTPPAGVCPPGTVDPEPRCREDYPDATNNGCSPCNPPGCVVGVFGSITCGETICGQTGNFTTNGTGVARDRDWFLFEITDEQKTVTWNVQAFDPTGVNPDLTPGITAQIWNLDGGCEDMDFIVGAYNGDDCAPVEVSATVPPGTYAVTVFGHSTVDDDGNPLPVLQYQPCNTVWHGTLSCEDSSTFDPPADLCANAPQITGSGFWSGVIDTNGYGWEGDPDPEWCDEGDPHCPWPCSEGAHLLQLDVDGWYKYVAPCSGRVTFQTCGYDVEGYVHGATEVATILGVWTGSCGSLTQYSDGVPPSPDCSGAGYNVCETNRSRVTISVDKDQTYYIQLMTEGEYGLITLEVSECILGCDPEACCYPDGSCNVSLPDDCVADGGQPWGPGTTCAPNPCPQP